MRNNPFWYIPKWALFFSHGLISVKIDEHAKLREQFIQARKSAGLTQAGLAERLGRPQSFVSKYERGERRVDVIELCEVCHALGIDPVLFLQRFCGDGS
jgi:transcriptional regulator with XRE-family HTH domain